MYISTVERTDLKIAIGIVTAGRREILSETIRFMAAQIRPADELLICPASASDLDIACVEGFPSPVKVLSGRVGASAQRNVLLDATSADVVVFFDDDFLPCPDFLLEVERLFVLNPTVVIATGTVLADGATGPGFDHQQGEQLLLNLRSSSTASSISPTFNGYGCNMAVNLTISGSRAVRFDERLPKYSWLEDVDFSRQCAPFGEIVVSSAMQGVHLGTKKAGRSPGKSLGYSQVANRIYIMRKGNMTRRQAVAGNVKNIGANMFRVFNPEPWTDRRGRLHGNFLALWDWIIGKIDPEKILKF